MRFGFCTSDELRVDDLARAGYDYLERGGSAFLPFEREVDWRPVRDRMRAAPVPTEAIAGFIPGHLKVTGPEVDRTALQRYLEVIVARAAEVGVQTINWGSGPSRHVPAGWSMRTAWDQLEAFCHQVADVVEPAGITIVIEPINPDETNILHTVVEGYALALRVNRPAIRCLCDYYHIERQGEGLNGVGLAAPWLRHAHTAGPDRLCPGPGQTQALYLAALKDAGYDGRLSIEAKCLDAESARAGLEHLRSLWAST
ncbi:MAG: sugar phosphate isomerase/epimerase [Chloroflexi bacterium]|nr:sugar phosphate isomerase/epimerase [Chloroflexota bacterium]